MTEEKKFAKELNVNNINQYEFSEVSHSAKVMAGTTPEDVLQPRFWKHVAKHKLKAGHQIFVKTEDNTWFGRLMVIKSDDISAIVTFMEEPRLIKAGGVSVVYDLKVDEKEASPVAGSMGGFEVKWRGGAKWAVVRTSDNVTLKSGFETKELAAEFMNGSEKEGAAAA